MDDIARRNIIARLKDFIIALHCMHWLIDWSSAVVQAAYEFLPEHEATSLSWNEDEKRKLWEEAVRGTSLAGV